MGRASQSLIQLWTNLIATNSAPTTQVPGEKVSATTYGWFKLPPYWDDAALVIASRAGTTPTVTAKLWGYFRPGQAAAARWIPIGPDPTGGGDATKAGLVNGGVAIGCYTGSLSRFSQLYSGLTAFSGIYLECTAISGTSAAYDAFLAQRKVRV